MTRTLAVDVSHLTMKFGVFTAVDDISFAVTSGEIFGFLGANGAGKTTTIRILCGLLIPTAGSALIAGEDIHTSIQAIKSKVGYMSQKFTLYNDLSVAENMEFTGRLRKLDLVYLKQRKQELFDFVEFRQSEKTLVRDLPGGIKQQMALAAALLHDPKIIFLDEPTAGVAPAVRMRFWQLINQLARQGKTVFVTTHYMDEAENCGRIALMRDGRIIALDTPASLKARTFPKPVMELDYTGTEPPAWLLELGRQKNVAKLNPYGRRYHAQILDDQAWKTWLRKKPDTVQVKAITPSLEDVFIRLVEG